MKISEVQAWLADFAIWIIKRRVVKKQQKFARKR